MRSDKMSTPSSAAAAGAEPSSDDVEALHQTASRPRPTSAWRTYCTQTVPARSLTAPLIAVTLACGLLDATTFHDYRTFASNQTGNTLVLTLVAVGLPTGSSLSLTLSSLFAFLLFAFLAGAVARVVGPRRRCWLVISLALQAVLFIIPSALLSSGVLQVDGSLDWLLIGLLAGGSGVQVAMARGSSNPELPSAMLTSPIVDLLVDEYLFVSFRHPRSRARNLRVLYIVSLVGGSFLGAGLIKAKSTELVWWLVVGIRVVILGWVLALAGEKPDADALYED